MPVQLYLIGVIIFAICSIVFIGKAVYYRVRYHGRFDTVSEQITGFGFLSASLFLLILYVG